MASGPEDTHETTRPPDDQDLILLARELNRLKVRYVVIGGLAINRLGFVRATDDIDLLIASDFENQNRVKQALEILPDQAVKELVDDDLSQWLVVRINDIITVDLMTQACGVPFEEAAPEIEWETLEGVSIPFANITLMRKLKQGSRDKDILDRKFLDRLASKGSYSDRTTRSVLPDT